MVHVCVLRKNNRLTMVSQV